MVGVGRSVQMSIRPLPVAILSLLLACGAFPGCASVDPRADYQNTQNAIAEHTGVSADALQIENLVAEKTKDLLENGLSVNEAVEVALLNNPGFAALFQDIGVSRAEVVQSQLLSNPSLSLLIKFPEGGGRSSIDLGLAQELVDLWQIPVRRKIAEAQLQQTVAGVVHRAVELAGEVKTQYYRVLALQMTEAAMRESLALAEKSVALVQTQHQAGAVSQLDVNLAKVGAIDVRLALMALERQRRLADIDLVRVLGLMDGERTWRLSDTLPMPEQLPSLDLAISTARRERMDVRMAEYQVSRTEDQLLQEHLKVFPSISAGFGLERTDRRALPGRTVLADTARDSLRNGQLTAPNIQTKAERDFERRQIIDLLMGPSLDITLPVWDQNQAQIAKARFQVEQKRKQLEDVLQTVRKAVEQAWIAADQSAALVRYFREEALPVAEQTTKSGREVYEKGEQSILFLLETQDSLVMRRRGFVEALGDYAVALAELERAVGGRLETLTTSRPSDNDKRSAVSSSPAP